MRSIVIPAPGTVEVREIPPPERKPGEALLRVLWGGVCGSDLSTYRGTSAYAKYPCTIGHEFSAEVVEADENAFGIRKGMIVTCNPYFNCGTCYSCGRGFVNCCTDNQTMGVQRGGAFSDYITMPYERIYDGQGIHPRTLALIEPFCISHHAISRAGVTAQDRVLVMGCGTIGLLAAMAARLKGAQVYIADISAEKLSYAARLGLENGIVNTSPETMEQAVLEATGGDRFDACVEATGVPEAFITCIDSAASQGRVVDVGVSKRNADLRYTEIQRKELNIFGSRGALKSDFMQTMAYVRNGQIDLEQIISREFPMEQAKAAFEDLDANSAGILKTVFTF